MRILTKLLLGPMARIAGPYLKSAGLLQTNSLFATSSIVWNPPRARVLVLAPHMDDETIGCGGALVRHVREGSEVTVAFLTDGRFGDPALAELHGEARRAAEEALVAVREEEARRALSVLGIDEYRCLRERDGSLQPRPSLVTVVRSLIEEFRPEYLYLPFFLDHHADHRAVTEIVRQATIGLDFEPICMAYEVWTALWPNCLVPIDDAVDIKRRALLVYGSQVAHCDYVHHALGINAYRAAPLTMKDTRYAEAFCMLPLQKYLSLYESNQSGPSARVTD